ncbi:hypothetical protein A3C32_01265 [Candidatus Daviesbacteria bacterium RIFCSPHIGHO2_02_FULL_41_14]|uniref:Phosphatidylglycerol--prolipoprotein diacylglyceryl transferase n=1 Tax=Candidatus Daviesbacteria bacterium RIFCSPLOWO2_01_FULL_40_24 TaxID=1797787 RepID=A0A1F5MK26_9BACT|nr:MAG: hypothetical protein A2780_02395 [Candidatus Daviesbacteria bacterium RIFCSPHIGHO2_01_FULL_41_45]OGE35029.1 MAG: hypothetical protein A3C32_01265 [Candidatus Daviesbacteria bacterium RIFCSPHIGHO2_02_FULL_41_14]OGE65736.1 MAG: hypothetical protein A3B49_02675 [Candidatus Daviesbacteria bacterium RIFCSPLOWO2_01_FULL_40_24]
MLPVIAQVGPISVSSFGVFLAIALVASLFVIWRIGRAYDVNEEKLTSLTVISFLGGLVGARILAVGLNLELFDTYEKVLQINRYPGLSFWGGLIGGLLTFWLLSLKNRLNFWSLADFAAAGFILGVAIADVGCFLGGCGYGVSSDLPIALNVVGLVGKRLPISLIEAGLLFLLFRIIWGQAIRFHYSGYVLASTFIYLGIVKFISEFFRGDKISLLVISNQLELSVGHIISLLLVLFGVVVIYQRSKRIFVSDLVSILAYLTSSKKRTTTLLSLKKRWYNLKVSWTIRLGRFNRKTKVVPRLTMRRLNVKYTPKNFR